MRLYHFTTQEHGFLALQNRRLKVARIGELNDPFEFLSWDIRDPATRARMRAWKAEQDRKWGLLCFSREWSNPLLWGHYARKHQGMVLGFDVPDGDLYNPVRYLPQRTPFPQGRALNGDDLEDVLLSKFDAWSYEAEYRCFCRLVDCVLEGGLYFERFSDTLQLRQVIVGDLATISRAELAVALGNQAAVVETFKARPAFGSFEVVRNLDGKLWK